MYDSLVRSGGSELNPRAIFRGSPDGSGLGGVLRGRCDGDDDDLVEICRIGVVHLSFVDPLLERRRFDQRVGGLRRGDRGGRVRIAGVAAAAPPESKRADRQQAGEAVPKRSSSCCQRERVHRSHLLVMGPPWAVAESGLRDARHECGRRIGRNARPSR
jgi:hypothetical protein